MSLRIATNVTSLNAYRNLNTQTNSAASSIEKLSSGLRINKAADDAAGLSISQGLTAQINGLTQAAQNAQDGINVAQIADGSLGQVQDILQRMRTLAVQASNTGANDPKAQLAAGQEITQLASELDRISTSTKFGNTALLDGSYDGTFQIGANAGADQTIGLDLTAAGAAPAATGFDSTALGVNALNLAAADGTAAVTNTNVQADITSINNAIQDVSDARATIGAVQNRLSHTITNLNVQIENVTSTRSNITDTDMASEISKFTSTQILQQAATSMLAQANAAPQSVLKLLQ